MNEKNLPGAQTIDTCHLCPHGAQGGSVAIGGIGRCCGQHQHVHLRLVLVVEQGVVVAVYYC